MPFLSIEGITSISYRHSIKGDFKDKDCFISNRQDSPQLRSEFVCTENLVSGDHLLRKIKRHIRFSFIYEKTRDLYLDIGRLCLDPVVLFKMMLIGYLYGIRPERQLEQENQTLHGIVKLIEARLSSEEHQKALRQYQEICNR